jgi:hypothetical protein
MQEICKPKWLVEKEMCCLSAKVCRKTIGLVGIWRTGKRLSKTEKVAIA